MRPALRQVLLGGGAGIFPGSISGLLRWYSAGNITGVADGGAVALWPDASTNLDAAVQSTALNKPAFILSGFNGRPIVRFDGVNGFMSFTALTTIRTAIFVLKATATMPDFAPLLGHASLFDWAAPIGVDTSAFDIQSPASASLLRGSLRVNGRSAGAGALFPRATAMSIVSLVATAGVSAQYITNDRNSGVRKWKGDFAEIILYDRALTTAELSGVETWLSRQYNIARAAPAFTTALTASITAQGDSLTQGQNASNTATKNYPRVMVGNLSGGNAAYMLQNIGVGGQTAAAVDTTSFAQDGLIRYNPLVAKNIYCIWAGTNDLRVGTTPAAAYISLKSIWAKARAAGFRVVVFTTLPRNDAGVPAGFETDRQTLNTLIKSDASLYDALADVGADATIGAAGAYSNATYYSPTDYTHPTDAGYAIVAGIAGTAVTSLL